MSSARDPSSADDRLLQAIESARSSRFYARHLAGCEIRSRADLPGLPRTSRDQVRAAGAEELLVVPPAEAGLPLEFVDGDGVRFSAWCGAQDLRKMADYARGLVPELAQEPSLLSRFSSASPVALVLQAALGADGAQRPAAEAPASAVSYDEAVALLQRREPEALACAPLEPLMLAEAARAQGIAGHDPFASIEVVFCSGAPLPAALRERIESDLGARVVEFYGSDESLLLGASCEQGHLHLATDLLEFEILDPRTWEPVPPGGRGVVTVTSLVHAVMPLVRFVTGDMVEIANQPCACGRPGFPVSYLGRCEEQIEIGGRVAMPFDVLDAAHRFAAELGTRIFLALLRPNDVRILVEVEDPSVSIPTRAYLDLRRRVGLPLDVELVGPNEILDRSVLLRSSPLPATSFIGDWRGAGPRVVSMTETVAEGSSHLAGNLFDRARRQLSAVRRRRRLERDPA